MFFTQNWILRKKEFDSICYKSLLFYQNLSFGCLPKVTPDGMKAFSVSEVKEGKFTEFMKLAYEQILLYSEIEGYRSEIEVFMSGTEALPLVGLEMPEP